MSDIDTRIENLIINGYGVFNSKDKQAIKQLMVDEFEKLNTQLENALKLDLYSITPDELDEIVEKCEGKHIQQVVYSTYHKAFTRICFGCMQIDTTLKLKEWKDE